MTFPIIQRLKNKEFHNYVVRLHEKLAAKCANGEDAARSNVDRLNEQSFGRLLSEDMQEVWVYLLTKGASASLIDILETTYPLRGQWWLYKASMCGRLPDVKRVLSKKTKQVVRSCVRPVYVAYFTVISNWP